LEAGSKGEFRYFAPDVEHLLSSVETPDDIPESEPERVPTEIYKSNRLKVVERGIYRDRISQTLFERPFIGNRRTTRSLGTTKISHARKELRRRKAARNSDDEDPQPEYFQTVGEVIRYYQEAGYPDKQLNPRTEKTRKEEARHCALLLKFWNPVRAKQTSIVTCDKYRDWRILRIKHGTGLRTIDCELTTLNSAFRFAYRKGQVGRNPLVDRPRYQPSRQVAHCRQFMPGDATELHEIARLLFNFRPSEVLGFQLLFTAYTGQRTCEILKLKINAGPDEPGRLIENGKCLRVWRAKGQDIVNPFCAVHDGLENLIAAHKKWISLRYPNASWFFPGRGGDELVNKGALAHALKRFREKGLINRRITPHGARAFFVTVRRSQGAPDSQIALEIGHTSGGSTLSNVYGGVPPEWVRGGGPKMTWLPSAAPAWSDLLLQMQKVLENEKSIHHSRAENIGGLRDGL
jgi:integrase